MGLFTLQHFLLQTPVEAFEVAGTFRHAAFQFTACLGLERDAFQIMPTALHHQTEQQHQHQERGAADGNHGAHWTVDQRARGEDADAPAGFGDVVGLDQPRSRAEVQGARLAGRVRLDGGDRRAFAVAQVTGRTEAPFRARGEDDHAVMVGHQQLFRSFAPQAFGVVEVDLDHQHADDFFAVAHGGSEEVAAFGRGRAETEKASEAPGHGFTEVRTEREIAADETIVFVPVRRRQRLPAGVHQVHDFGTGLCSDVLQQAIGVALADAVVWRAEYRAQGRQVAENLRQHFIAVQGAQQVGDVQIEGLAVLSGQFAAVIALGEMFQRPQQRRQTQGQQREAAPAGSAGEGWFHEPDAPEMSGALCLGSGEDVSVLEQHCGLILGGQLRRFVQLPVDAQRGVIPANAALGRWVVVVSGLVEEFSELAQYHETMGETFRHPQLTMVFGRQAHSHRFSEVRRAAANVHGDIQYFTDSYPDQFALSVLQLVMQATQYAFLRARVVVLNELRVQTGSVLERLGIETLVEKAALVTEHLRFDDQDTGQVGGDYIHGEFHRQV
ncbi:hypothetical protein D3C87_1031010 [compost metagenome]